MECLYGSLCLSSPGSKAWSQDLSSGELKDNAEGRDVGSQRLGGQPIKDELLVWVLEWATGNTLKSNVYYVSELSQEKESMGHDWLGRWHIMVIGKTKAEKEGGALGAWGRTLHVSPPSTAAQRLVSTELLEPRITCWGRLAWSWRKPGNIRSKCTGRTYIDSTVRLRFCKSCASRSWCKWS